MPNFNFKDLSIEELIKLRAEINVAISEKERAAYKEAVADVIKAVKKVVETNPCDTAFVVDINDDDYESCYDWRDLLDALERK